MSTVLKEQLRPMQLDDLPAVMLIEKQAYEFPWTEGIFNDCLRNHYHCHVYETGNQIIAYAVMSIAVDECHLLNICVSEKFRNQGVGRYVIQSMLDMARRLNMRTAFLEVRSSNTGAYNLYYDLGFNEVGLRRNYYPARKGREDAMVLAYEFKTFDK
ncbi:MAG TPA: ribosomal-protein-alanine N-acetyltransferase [Gammaproteobacteria bacterium]|nr:ribosomal-protein-alanine N-acetyltransferase [Gammaproteobacteria bacterium]